MKDYAVFFDVDGTLAPFNRGASIVTTMMMRQLFGFSNVKYVGSVTGKPVVMMLGFFRQFIDNLHTNIGDVEKKLLISGNNGYRTQQGLSWPPMVEHFLDVDEKWKSVQAEIHEALLDISAKNSWNLWFQPNDIGITAFHGDERILAKVVDIAEAYLKQKDMLELAGIFVHQDAIDIMPASVNKGIFLSDLISGKILGLEPISASNIIVVGDGSNDIPMIQFAKKHGGLAIAVGNNAEVIAESNHNFDTIEVALEFIIRTINQV